MVCCAATRLAPPTEETAEGDTRTEPLALVDATEEVGEEQAATFTPQVTATLEEEEPTVTREATATRRPATSTPAATSTTPATVAATNTAVPTVAPAPTQVVATPPPPTAPAQPTDVAAPTAVPPTSPPAPTAVPTEPPPAAGDVQIVFIFYDGDPNPAEPNEYVAIQNLGGTAVQLQGWTLRDMAEHVYTFPAWELQPGQTCRVYTNLVLSEWCGFSYGNNQAIWNNSDGDCAYLRDAAGAEVDVYCYQS